MFQNKKESTISVLGTLVVGSVPLIIASISNVGSGFVSLYYIGRADSEATLLAGIGLGMTLMTSVVRTYVLGFNLALITLCS